MEKKRIGDLVEIIRGVSYKKDQSTKIYKEQYVGVLRANNIIEGEFSYDDLVYVPPELVSNRQLIKEGDIVITMSSGSKAHVGKVALARKDLEYSYGAFCAKIQSTGIMPAYLYYSLQDFRFRKYIESQSKGTNINNIKQSYIQNYEIPVPPLDEQARIVSRIEELFSELDNGVETLKKTKQQLAVYRQAVLKECFSVCSEVVKAKDVCTHITDGDHSPPPKAQNGIPFIMISNIKNHVIDWEGTNFVGEDYYNQIGEKRTPRKGDVLYTVTGSFGIPVLIDFDKKFCFQRHIALLRPNERIDSSFLYYALQTPQVFAQASKRATGTAQKTVGLAVLRTIEIPFIDSINEQRTIVSKIEERMTVCDSIEQTIDAALQQAEAMRQSILKKAFEGKL